MRFSTVAAAAAIAPALANAAYHADLKEKLGTARIHNMCDYPVYIWSVKKDQGCTEGNMKKLKTGETYSEMYRDDFSDIGVSIKISKTNQCKGNTATGENIDITQLEYHINHASQDYLYNFLDVSFVDCLGEQCPSRDKFCLKSGNNGDERLATAGADGAVCPILKCNSVEECSALAYVNWDDVRTKSCEPAADMDFYLCTNECDGEVKEPKEDESDDEEEEETVASSTAKEVKSEPTPVSLKAAKVDNVAAAAVTPAPKEEAPKQHKVKTEVVYVTKYEYVNAKRHGHAARHPHIRNSQ